MKDFFFNTIQEFNDYIGVKTLHPLVSIARVENISPIQEAVHHYGLYALFLKENKPNIRYWLSIPSCSTAPSLARTSPAMSSSTTQATKHYIYLLPR